MPTEARTRPQLPIAPLVIGAAIIIAAVVLFLLNRPAPPAAQSGPASPEARAYVRNLELSDVTMQATENFMKQQVVEVQGKIKNNGPRPVRGVDIFCLFYGVNGREVYRERVPIVQSKGLPLRPGEMRGFRLPFDHLPDAWNQGVPSMFIAQIAFAS
jgi:hypothetical protein